jgi:hypothetical protein
MIGRDAERRDVERVGDGACGDLVDERSSQPFRVRRAGRRKPIMNGIEKRAGRAAEKP